MNESAFIYPWQQDSWDYLLQQLEQQRLPHALLLQGPTGCGIEKFADVFARYLLCEQPASGFPCGNCSQCHLLDAQTHPDFIRVSLEQRDDGKVAKVIKVDQIRKVVDFVTHTSLQGGRRVIVIEPAEAMNPNAANALLKSLEEPGSNTQFLLIAHYPAKVMATIRSRCQRVELPQPPKDVVDQWLATYITDDKVRQRLLGMSGGSPLLALEWQELEFNDAIGEMVTGLKQLLAGEQSPLTMASTWLDVGMVNVVTWWWRWLLLEVKHLVQNSPERPGFIRQFGLSEQRVLGFMQQLLTARQQLESTANPNEQLLVESLLIDWANLRNR